MNLQQGVNCLAVRGFLMSRTLIIIFSFIAALCMPAKGNERTFVSLLTCSPGEEVYAYFGHTALRYCNPDKNLDLVFNYGVFDFSEPGFVAKFVSGKTDYMLGVIEYPYFIQEYAMRGSEVTEQVLALDSAQEERFFALLRKNYQPSNRIYRYNYFYNNCTTKARDIIEAAVAPGGEIKYATTEECPTFREVVHRFTQVSPWYTFGIDLLLGCEADIRQDTRTLQFIPSTLMGDFSKATINNTQPLVASESKLIEKIEDENEGTHPFTPEAVFALLLIATLLNIYFERRKKRVFWGIDALLLTMQGVAGLLITYMVLFSTHPTVGSNQLILLLNPLPLLILPVYIYEINSRRTPRTMWLQAAIAALFLMAAPFLTQEFPTAIYIFAVILLIRSLSIITNKK